MVDFVNRSSAADWMLGGASRVLSRHYTTLDPAGSQHYTIPEITLAGDFEIEVQGAFSGTAGAMVFSGGTGVGGLEVYMSSDGYPRLYFEGVGIGSFGTTSFRDGRLNTLKVVRTGHTLTASINNVDLEFTHTVATTCVITTLAAREGGSFLLGGIYSFVKITEAGVLKRHYKINESWVGPSTVLVDSASSGQDGTAVNITSADSTKFTKSGSDWIGPELVVNGGFDIDSGWNKSTGWSIEGGQAIWSGPTGDLLYQTVDRPSLYRVRGSILGAGYIKLYDGSSYGDDISAGVFSVDVVNANTGYGHFTLRGSSGIDVSVDNISLKQILETP